MLGELGELGGRRAAGGGYIAGFSSNFRHRCRSKKCMSPFCLGVMNSSKFGGPACGYRRPCVNFDHFPDAEPCLCVDFDHFPDAEPCLCVDFDHFPVAKPCLYVDFDHFPDAGPPGCVDFDHFPAAEPCLCVDFDHFPAAKPTI
ncbi:hypothetical protein [Alicyclobacillus sp. ALC3]|uniref:hypothetical protein n=1 Tax=Alicyclobacillus sp. ALC3 TaxID=2796143 RepID=UPI002378BBE7|nr:hypothetical protein [Alicyclobacillus sp. ALC3]WDL98606.1 hypothetical protein JC200_08045 [Alicyclobacillus sp. ALC3]